MDDKPQDACLRYYGISPWEIEVLYGLLNDKFTVVQEETGYGEIPMTEATPTYAGSSKIVDPDTRDWQGNETDPDTVSLLIITIPVQFSEEFFQWFGFKRWEKMKSIIKEMKRRRGNRKAIRVEIIFKNEEWNCYREGRQNDGGPILSSNDERLPDYPHIKFVIDSSENHIFNSAIEKIDVMVELLPYHLNHSKIKNWCKPMIVDYTYDVTFSKWYVGHVLSFDGGRTFSINELRN